MHATMRSHKNEDHHICKMRALQYLSTRLACTPPMVLLPFLAMSLHRALEYRAIVISIIQLFGTVFRLTRHKHDTNTTCTHVVVTFLRVAEYQA